MGIPLCVICCFSLAAFNICSLCLISVNLINMCLGVFHLGFILFVPLSILAAKDVPQKLPMLKTAFSARADMHPYLLVLLYLGVQCRIHVSGIRIRVFSREEEKHQGGFLELTC